MPALRTDAVGALLAEREARSLTLLVAIVLVSFVAQGANFWLQHAARSGAGGKPLVIAVYLGISLLNCVALLYLLRRRLWVGAVGLIVAFFAASFAATTGLIMWWGYSPDAPVALLAKLPVAVAGTAAIAGMTLTLRPLYVIITGAGVIITLFGFYVLAASDAATIVARRAMESYSGLAIGTMRLAIEVMFVGSATAAAALATALARRTIGEAVALQRTRDQLSRYFSPEVAARIAGGGETLLHPGGREQEIAVLFADLQGFTRICAATTPAQAMALLSEYHRRMVAEIFRAGGTLDKFTGDGIMATFGTPESAADAAARAVRAARGMIAALAELNRDRAARGEPALVQRIGINAGPALVGNVGTDQRLEFTAIGDTVNVASRIEKACKKTGRAAMLSAAVVARLADTRDIERLGPLSLDGQPQAIELYALG